MPIRLPEKELVRRRALIGRLLVDLRADKKHRPACDFYRGPELDRKVLAAHDGLVGGEHYRDWMFRTGAPAVWGQYFEIWSPEDVGQRSWTLQAAYLTILEIRKSGRTEILGIHCDPADGSSEPTRSFKRGPHLHVTCAREPLPKSHFPLNYGHLSNVLQDSAALTKAIRDAVFVVRREVLERFQPS